MQGLGFTSLIGVGKDETVSPVSGGDKDAFDQVENALVARIQKTWLGQTLTTQMSASGGSYAAAQVHNEVRKDKRDADLKLVEPAGQTLVNLLWRVNNRPGLPPSFKLQDAKGLDEARAKRDKDLVDAGILKFTPKYITSRYDLEPDDFELPSASPPQLVPPPTQGNAALKLALREGQRFSKDQALLERLMDEGMSILPAQPIPAALVKAAILAATSPEDLAERLALLYQDHPPAALAEVLERALFAADVLGYVTAEKRIGVA
jgi:phage gp29-like protein